MKFHNGSLVMSFGSADDIFVGDVDLEKISILHNL